MIQIIKPFTQIENQNMSPQNLPLWHTDYFELQALKKQQVQGHTDPPVSTLSCIFPLLMTW